VLVEGAHAGVGLVHDAPVVEDDHPVHRGGAQVILQRQAAQAALDREGADLGARGLLQRPERPAARDERVGQEF